MPPLFFWLVLALLAVAVLAGVRLFLVRPRQRAFDYREAPRTDARAALDELLSDPDAAAGRGAELRGDWAAAHAAYQRALESLRLEDPGNPALALKRRALESKLEELERLRGGGR